MSVILLRHVSKEGLFCSSAWKQWPALQEAVDKSRALVKQVMLEQGIPGAVVAVIKDGRLVWSEGMGLADVENNTPCTAESGEDVREEFWLPMNSAC